MILWVMLGCLRKAIMSSAKSPILCSTPFIVTPLSSLFCQIAWTKGLIKIANRVGDKQHPCLIDLCNHIFSVTFPLILILAEVFWYIVLISYTDLLLNPYNFFHNFQLPQLNAFPASILTSTVLCLSLCTCLIICCVLRILSWVWRPGMNLVWSLSIHSAINVFICLEIIDDLYLALKLVYFFHICLYPYLVLEWLKWLPLPMMLAFYFLVKRGLECWQ